MSDTEVSRKPLPGHRGRPSSAFNQKSYKTQMKDLDFVTSEEDSGIESIDL